jgi:transposase
MVEAADIEVLPKNVQEYIRDLERKNLILKERLDLLLYKRFVRSAEQFTDKGQGELFNERETVKEEPEEEIGREEIKSYTRKKAGRKAIDPLLPRVGKIIDISEEEKTCACGVELVKIGEETGGTLHIIPQKIYVEKTIRIKYVCPECEGTGDEDKPAVRIAPVEPVIIPRSIVSASLLGYIIIQKYCDHLPYYRQEKQFERIGVHVSRQDMSNWQRQAWEKLDPLHTLMERAVKTGPVLQMDETTVQVMGEEGRSDTQKSYMWLARGGPPEKPVILYEYHPTRSAIHAKIFLKDFSGYVQTDGYDGYDAALEDRNDIIHVGCFAHSRCRFFEASKVSAQPGSAEEGMNYIRSLYLLENSLRVRDLEEREFLRERKERAEPILAAFKAWLDKRAGEVPPSLLLGKAISYTLNQWDKLVAYLGSPYLTPDNNACENAIRPFVLGRKNWLFNKSPEGAEGSCGMYSLIETARQNGLEPLEYLRTLFERCPLAKTSEDWEKLLPWNIFTA